jgi:hypothetical protein
MLKQPRDEEPLASWESEGGSVPAPEIDEKATVRNTRNTVEVGELVAVVFDVAAAYSTDRRQVSRLATQVVRIMLRRVSEARSLQPAARYAH